LPAVSLVILALVSTLWRRVRYWTLIVAAVAIAFAGGLFTNPPYGFSLEDNLAYRDYVLLHAEGTKFLVSNYPSARVLTAWPASDELIRPWLGYLNVGSRPPLRLVRVENFSPTQIELASRVRTQFDVAFVFSTKYQPPHPLLGIENWDAWRRVKERFFGYHRDLLPEEIADRLGGTIAYHNERNGQWIAVIAIRP
jgi:hypothetical protein